MADREQETIMVALTIPGPKRLVTRAAGVFDPTNTVYDGRTITFSPGVAYPFSPETAKELLSRWQGDNQAYGRAKLYEARKGKGSSPSKREQRNDKPSATGRAKASERPEPKASEPENTGTTTTADVPLAKE